MTIDIYKNSSAPNVVNKSITLIDNLDCYLKEDCDISNPTIEVYDTNALNGNYIWIPLFSRYYFINKITTQSIDTLLIEAHVDVLMSFQSAIMNASGIIGRQQNVWNAYLNDNLARKMAYPRVQTKKFSMSFNNTPTYILIASGNRKVS